MDGEQNKKQTYGLDPGDATPASVPAPSPTTPTDPADSTNSDESPTASDLAPASKAGGDDGSKDPPKPDEEVWEPVLLEGEALTACPDCGAPMSGRDEVVCLRCGFDVAANQKIRVQTGEEIVEEKPVEPERPPLSPEGRGGLQLPAIIAGASMLVMTIAFLVGSDGLFPSHEEMYLRADHARYDSPREQFTVSGGPLWRHRFGDLFQYYLFTLIIAASTYAGLLLIARLDKRRIGDGPLGMLRALAVIAACGMVLLLGLPEGWSFAETILQIIGMSGVFLLGTRALFRTTLRESAVLGGMALGFFLALLAVAKVMSVLVS